ncbi:MAG: flagellar biosynthetic protein FliO, partial [Steroidobacteraceae bacterium]
LPAHVHAQAAAPAASARPFASPDVVTAMPAGGIGSVGQVTLALLLVLGAVFGVAWLIRRLRSLTLGGTQTIEVVAQVGLGARERAVLVKVAGEHVLLGVSPGRVTALHVLPPDAVFDKPAAAAPSGVAQRPNFKSLLTQSLGK